MSTTSSNQDTSNNDFQVETGTSSIDLTTSTFKLHSAPTEQQAAGDTKFITNGPPSYTSLYQN